MISSESIYLLWTCAINYDASGIMIICVCMCEYVSIARQVYGDPHCPTVFHISLLISSVLAKF